MELKHRMSRLEPASGGALKIAYVVVMFPCYSETFVKREILEIESRGIEVTILSLRSFSEKIMDGDARPLLSRTLYSPYLLSLDLLRSNLYFLFRRPKAYLGIIRLFISRLILHPRVFVKSVALFPKSVHFARLLREKGVGHVHSHFTNYPATAAYIIYRLTGIPFTMTAHAHDIFQNQLLLREKISVAMRLFTISEYNRRFILEKCRGVSPEKIEVLHSGVDVSRMPRALAERPAGDPLILSVGRMVAMKGFDTLIRSAAILRGRGIRFRCTIVGEGPERKRLTKLIDDLSLHDVVNIVGALERNEVLKLMERCTVFVLACRPAGRKCGVMDGIPGGLYESMGMGLPVVSCAVSGIPELVVDGQTGLLVPPGDERRLTEALGRLLEDEGLRKRVAEAGRKKVEVEFNLKKVADRLLEVFTFPEAHLRTPGSRIAVEGRSRRSRT